MRRLVTPIVIAIVLFAAGALAERESAQRQREADIYERLATLRNEDLDDPIARYWNGDYESLQRVAPTAGDLSPEHLLIRANAAFRANQRMKQSRQEQARQLDAVLEAYASVLKSATFLPDAAYNYELVARLREGVSRPRTAAPTAPADTPGAGGLPGGPTIHGHPGGPPPSTKGEEFEILTPMEFGDRETQPEPSPGGKPLRKG